MARTTERLMLTINKDVFRKLKKKSKEQGYTNEQQFVYDLIRRATLTKKKTNAGRPLTGMARDVDFLTSSRPLFSDEKTWYKRKKK